MKTLRTILSAVPIGLACVCMATTSIQAAAFTAMWAGGAITKDKLVRYAAAIYGLDLSELRGDGPDDPTEETTQEM